MNIEQYYLELSIFVASVIAGLALKDWSVSFIKGLNFKMNPQFKEGDKVKVKIVGVDKMGRTQLSMKDA